MQDVMKHIASEEFHFFDVFFTRLQNIFQVFQEIHVVRRVSSFGHFWIPPPPTKHTHTHTPKFFYYLTKKAFTFALSARLVWIALFLNPNISFQELFLMIWGIFFLYEYVKSYETFQSDKQTQNVVPTCCYYSK